MVPVVPMVGCHIHVCRGRPACLPYSPQMGDGQTSRQNGQTSRQNGQTSRQNGQTSRQNGQTSRQNGRPSLQTGRHHGKMGKHHDKMGRHAGLPLRIPPKCPKFTQIHKNKNTLDKPANYFYIIPNSWQKWQPLAKTRQTPRCGFTPHLTLRTTPQPLPTPPTPP